jgi:hypothetical protein
MCNSRLCQHGPRPVYARHKHGRGLARCPSPPGSPWRRNGGAGRMRRRARRRRRAARRARRRRRRRSGTRSRGSWPRQRCGHEHECGVLCVDTSLAMVKGVAAAAGRGNGPAPMQQASAGHGPDATCTAALAMLGHDTTPLQVLCRPGVLPQRDRTAPARTCFGPQESGASLRRQLRGAAQQEAATAARLGESEAARRGQEARLEVGLERGRADGGEGGSF